MNKIKKKIVLTYEESHKNIEGELYKLCNRCNEWFPCTTEYFYKNKSSGDGYYPYCKECAKQQAKKWIENNPEKYAKSLKKCNARPERAKIVREYNKRRREAGFLKEWQRNNKDKIKKYQLDRANKDHKISKEEWNNCKQYFDNNCAYCGLPLDEHFVKFKEKLIHSDFHKEHVIHNGNNDISNCVPSCKRCNSHKWTMRFEDWYNADNSIFNEERYNKILKWLNEDYKLYINEKLII